MFGSLLSTVIKTVSLPIDAANAGLDILTGGDGSKEGRLEIPLSGDLEQLRDAIADVAKDIDE
jgi:hypothetical protein